MRSTRAIISRRAKKVEFCPLEFRFIGPMNWGVYNYPFRFSSDRS
jgi:hypothetical protein